MMTSCQEFEVTVHTSPGPTCGTFSRLWLNLIGSQGETTPISVNEGDLHLHPGSSCRVRVSANAPLGRLVLVRLRLEARTGFPNLDWHCSQVEVCRLADGQVEEEGRGGEGSGSEDPETQVFPCNRWLRLADGDVELNNGKLCLLKDETDEQLKELRLRQLQHQQKLIRWCKFVDGAPHCVDLNSMSELGPNLSYTHKSPAVNLHYLKGFIGRAEAWASFTELEMFFAQIANQNNMAKFIRAHWMEDWYFGHQCLNGCNPLLLHQIRLLPPHLSVTSDMLRPFLPEGSSLEAELQKGSVYLLDYEVLDGVPANVVNGKQTYLSAPLCLLHLNQQGQLLPIAIQLQQKPGPENPVFLPSDPGCDWLLAKIWVHSADFQCHQLASHYLRTHMLGELCCVATLRQLPDQHPLHQLLMPHIRTSLQINYQARVSLLAPDGVFDKAVGCGLEALPVFLSRASAGIHYRSLCVPDDLSDRGVDKLPQSYYAQDALRVWDALHRFVFSWVDLYYSGDDTVQQDSELQHWITDINTHSFTQKSGFPQSFQTKAEVSKFVTMIIYSCSALHAAVNFSQLDFALWTPNCPVSMLRPPPQLKGAVTEEDILSFLPDVNSTCRVLTTLTLLSQPAVNYVPLCHYKEAVFGDGAHRRLVEEVQAELQAISDDITERNSQLELPYPYLCPGSIENSVAI
ncbi:polyunsaturated fatty acid lipoxygenase ALOX15B [Thunnus maccoyii]|uniref:polyunsaturated fatty acid lipoxygenase ALOX15B n=1 Tax=Thunnus maccoyii TaxID=8240 RepID=UPI001C4C2442|nr:polyunsaturated fatty acid lipoxygenase ALOX15B [Thunnus maccoyii]XP_042288294.1 polyunsaturated fatty acid lipoxygenase ALOX15B [Thunnus maccoyii]XP_042288295.1 polyunsaturated fatty acid lipoxygenase ALOX15B [Thunnus maccoyii]XP_042288296.1 polyunsaturated fatty acid lipoxygenase ALOX15B [Thunnus maccoyii]XP_042288297.1 polyunsaturated fatty acid lipoxygenase ALOX15B [Thunnus maccoyii]XP_042288298.1 polyunsaturated fatty acid lipoxygenase ALOX15B [Thunnus maccoyii]